MAPFREMKCHEMLNFVEEGLDIEPEGNFRMRARIIWTAIGFDGDLPQNNLRQSLRDMVAEIVRRRMQ